MKRIKSLYWKILKHIYAGMAMHGLMTNPVRNVNVRNGHCLGGEIAEISERVADYLVAQMKEEKS